MCPSFRVTRDEAAPDARPRQYAAAGAFRTARPGLASDAVRAAMDLCVSCKGCRRDCPTGVDMASMKIEFMHHWQRAHGLSLRERLIANLPRWAPKAASCRGCQSARTLPGAKTLGEKLAGLSRGAPCRAGAAIRSSARAHAFASRTKGATADVVLFVDTFTNYFEPENARAAVAVLHAAGYRVQSRAPAPTMPPGGRCAAAAPSWPRAWSMKQRRSTTRAGGDAAVRSAWRRHRRPRAVVPADAARRISGDGARRRRATAGRARHAVRGIPGREHAAGRLRLDLAPLPQSRPCCTDTATRRRSTRFRRRSPC